MNLRPEKPHRTSLSAGEQYRIEGVETKPCRELQVIVETDAEFDIWLEEQYPSKTAPLLHSKQKGSRVTRFTEPGVFTDVVLEAAEEGEFLVHILRR